MVQNTPFSGGQIPVFGVWSSGVSLIRARKKVYSSTIETSHGSEIGHFEGSRARKKVYSSTIETSHGSEIGHFEGSK